MLSSHPLPGSYLLVATTTTPSTDRLATRARKSKGPASLSFIASVAWWLFVGRMGFLGPLLWLYSRRAGRLVHVLDEGRKARSCSGSDQVERHGFVLHGSFGRALRCASKHQR